MLGDFTDEFFNISVVKKKQFLKLVSIRWQKMHQFRTGLYIWETILIKPSSLFILPWTILKVFFFLTFYNIASVLGFGLLGLDSCGILVP